MDQLVIVLTVSLFFLLSLTGAYILFKFLKSSAIVKTHRYRAGGAVGGFLLIYGMLYGSYYQMANQIAEQLAKKQGPTITGTVTPQLEGGKVVLAVAANQPDSQGHFRLSTPFNLDLKKSGASLYLIAPQDARFADNGASVYLLDLPSDPHDLENMKVDVALEKQGQPTQ